jgi:hypothetical protein
VSKYFKFNQDYVYEDEVVYRKGTELKIQNINSIDCVMDGCFIAFRLNNELWNNYGDIVNRPY